jgi:hypothetical protein
MKWLLENPWVLIVIAGLVAQVLKALQKGQGAETEAPAKQEYEFDDPELAERTRKIREEIRRKIEQRRGGANQPQPASPVVITPSPEATPPVLQLPRVIREVLAPEPVPAPVPVLASAQAEEMERQNTMLVQLREAEFMRQAAAQRIAFEATTADTRPAELAQTRAALLDDLREPAALRRAFILREVLGPPIALR